MELLYSILDPTGNITALVESDVPVEKQPAVAAEIMRRHPEVEQVGFLRADGADGLPELRMAGGEFCGNASMCAAALALLSSGHKDAPACVHLRVSGVSHPVEVCLTPEGEDRFYAALLMPPALGLEERVFRFDGASASFPLVRLEGISHLMVEPPSAFFALLEEREAAERAVRCFCEELRAECLGLMFLEGGGADRSLTPLVFVPGSGTMFWENSCASGSAAAGMYLAAKSGAPVDVTLREPGGVLRVSCDPVSFETRLRGGVRLVSRFSEKISESC